MPLLLLPAGLCLLRGHLRVVLRTAHEHPIPEAAVRFLLALHRVPGGLASGRPCEGGTSSTRNHPGRRHGELLQLIGPPPPRYSPAPVLSETQQTPLKALPALLPLLEHEVGAPEQVVQRRGVGPRAAIVHVDRVVEIQGRVAVLAQPGADEAAVQVQE